ncbi:hypothetical protein CS078_25195, partial [Pseudomonas prosekii]
QRSQDFGAAALPNASKLARHRGNVTHQIGFITTGSASTPMHFTHPPHKTRGERACSRLSAQRSPLLKTRLQGH